MVKANKVNLLNSDFYSKALPNFYILAIQQILMLK